MNKNSASKLTTLKEVNERNREFWDERKRQTEHGLWQGAHNDEHPLATLPLLPTLETRTPQRRHVQNCLDNPKRQALEALLLTIQVPEGKEDVLDFTLNALCQVDSTGPGTMPAKYKIDPSAGGRPRNVRAQMVTIVVGDYYFRMTGLKPTLIIPTDEVDLTPLGPFFELLTAIFETLGLKDSVEHFAKDISKSFTVPKNSAG